MLHHSLRLQRQRPRQKVREKRQLWAYEPAVDRASKYWDVGVEGKKTRTVRTASYRDDDARSDSEDDPEDLFKPQKDEESSTESE